MSFQLMVIIPNGNKIIFKDEALSINSLDISKFPKKIKKHFGKGDISRECDFNYKNITISVFGFSDGKAGKENKFDLPPPIDQTLYFGCLIIIAHKKENIINIDVDTFNEFYERIFEGFVNLGDEDTWSEEEDANTDDIDFIVDDNFIEYEEGYVDDESEEDEYVMDSETESDEKYIYLDDSSEHSTVVEDINFKIILNII